MRLHEDYEKFEDLVFDEEEEREDEDELETLSSLSDRPEPRNYWPVVQVVLCALLLIAMVVTKFAKPETYEAAVAWYKAEIVKEVEMPRFVPEGEKTEESEQPDESASSSSSEAASAQVSTDGVKRV